MTSTDTATVNAMAAGPSARAVAAKKPRDLRLDFFRGMAMFIIFLAHTPNNYWALWIPARFGFSDATEIFVFCSGMASALAFGAIFADRGWLMGAARIVHRIWQVYWAHIGLFFAVLVLVTVMDASGWFSNERYSASLVGQLNLQLFYDKARQAIPGLFSLTYVPNYFDILPMYLVILALIPVVMGLAQVSLGLVFAFCLALWLCANLGLIGMTPFNFGAQPWSDVRWFFNPLGWQLIFFTGFAFMRGWLPRPPVDTRLIVFAALVLIATIPFAYSVYNPVIAPLQSVAKSVQPLSTHLWGFADKTSFGPLRYIHFLAFAYIAWVAAGEYGHRLADWGRAQIVVDVIRKVGQQSLAVFISSLVLAQFIGAFFQMYGSKNWVGTIGNLIGFAALIGVAYAVAWFKGQPWRKNAAASARALPSGTLAQPSGLSGPLPRAEPGV